MSLLRMDASIRHQTEQVQAALAATRMLHRGEQHGVGKELSVLDHQIDAGDVHVHDAAGADVEMSDFAVSHLPFGQADKRSTGMDESVGIFAQQAVVGRLAGQRDRVGLGFGAIAPAVEDDEDEWFRTGHKISVWLLADGSSFSRSTLTSGACRSFLPPSSWPRRLAPEFADRWRAWSPPLPSAFREETSARWARNKTPSSCRSRFS